MSTQPSDTLNLAVLNDGNFSFNEAKTTLDSLCAHARDFLRVRNLPHAAFVYQFILEHSPRHTESLHGLGLIAFQKNDLSEALDFLNQALDISPDKAVLYCDRGRVFLKQQEFVTAIKNFDLALFLNNSYIDAYANRGIALEGVGLTALALENYEKAISLDPSFASAWYNRGNIFKTQGGFEIATRCYLVATELNPSFWEAFTNLGLSWFALKRFDLALQAYDQALLLMPNLAVIHYNRANACRTMGDTVQANKGYDVAIELNPTFAAAFANRGLVKKDMNLLEDAAKDYSSALSLDPGLLEAQWNLSIVELMRGDWIRGWDGYELRFEHTDLRDSVGVRSFKEPRWNAALPLKGKRILIYCEQGLGDAIQFSRYMPVLSAQGAFVILEVQEALKNLFEHLEGVNHLIVRGDVLPEFDYYCPLLSLPKEFHTIPQTIPAVSKFRSKPSRLEHWQDRVESIERNINNNTLTLALTHSPTKKIGLVWRGNPNHTNDHNRSLSLSELLRHLPPQFIYFVLQKEINSEDLLLLKGYSNIYNFSTELVDLIDTASLCLQLDFVVCVDTSVAHLSACLNVPTLLLIPFSPDWRWLMQRQDSPWYPSLKLFRQPVPKDWSTPLSDINMHLLSARS